MMVGQVESVQFAEVYLRLIHEQLSQFPFIEALHKGWCPGQCCGAVKWNEVWKDTTLRLQIKQFMQLNNLLCRN